MNVKSLYVFFIGIFLFSFAFAWSASAQVEKLPEMEREIMVQALLMLDDNDYAFLQKMTDQQKRQPIGLIDDSDLESLLANEPDRKALLKKIKSSAMFSYRATEGEKLQLIFIRRQGKFMKSCLEGYGKAKASSVIMAFAAKISHEIWHLQNPSGSETSAIEREKEVFQELRQKNLAILQGQTKFIEKYLGMLDEDLVYAKLETNE